MERVRLEMLTVVLVKILDTIFDLIAVFCIVTLFSDYLRWKRKREIIMVDMAALFDIVPILKRIMVTAQYAGGLRLQIITRAIQPLHHRTIPGQWPLPRPWALSLICPKRLGERWSIFTMSLETGFGGNMV